MTVSDSRSRRQGDGSLVKMTGGVMLAPGETEEVLPGDWEADPDADPEAPFELEATILDDEAFGNPELVGTTRLPLDVDRGNAIEELCHCGKQEV